jgi:hypothetical protein
MKGTADVMWREGLTILVIFLGVLGWENAILAGFVWISLV